MKLRLHSRKCRDGGTGGPARTCERRPCAFTGPFTIESVIAWEDGHRRVYRAEGRDELETFDGDSAVANRRGTPGQNYRGLLKV